MSNFVHLPIQKNQLFQIEEYHYKGPDFPYHYHPEIEITYVCNSSGLRVIGDHIESYSQDDLIVVGPNIPHQWQKDVEFTSSGSKREHIFVIHINGDLLVQLTQTIAELSRLSNFVELARKGVKFDKRVAKGAKMMIQTLHEASGSNAFTKLIELLDYLQAAPYDVLLTPENSLLVQTKEGAKIFKIISSMHEHYHTGITARELAKMYNMSLSSFSHYFKRKTAKTYSSYLTDIRIGHVCKRLRSTEDSIAEIAFECGFQNLSNFNRLFKNKMGRTPNSYRKFFSEINA